MVRLALAAATVNDTDTGALPVQLADETGALITASAGIPTKAALQRQVLQSSSAHTTSGNSGNFTAAIYREVLLFLNVTVASGTGPTLNVFIDSSPDAGTTWFQLAQLGPTNIAAAIAQPIPNTYMLALGLGEGTPNLVGETLRVRWVIAGTTPSFTFEVRGLFK